MTMDFPARLWYHSNHKFQQNRLEQKAQKVMIKFSCKNCGQRIKVPDEHAGKKGRCPKCKTVVVIPEIDNDIFFKSPDSLTDDTHDTPKPPQFEFEKPPPAQTGPEEASADPLSAAANEYFLRPRIDEIPPPERKLPWVLDVFLYPISMSGLINLGIFWILPILIGFMRIILPIPFLGLIVSVIVAAYMYYFFMECIRDSASGGIRAPENIGSMPDIGDVFWQLLEIVASVFIFWGPVGIYLICKMWQASDLGVQYDSKTDLIFWLLLGYAIFFFPMGILAVAMFNSTSAFNPFLWIASIFSAFFQYCGLVLLFCVLALLASMIVAVLAASWVFAFFFGAIFIYHVMIAAHLLGRFYYLNSEKLNWEV